MKIKVKLDGITGNYLYDGKQYFADGSPMKVEQYDAEDCYDLEHEFDSAKDAKYFPKDIN